MKKILISLLLIICCQSVTAQEVWYESRYSSYYNYNQEALDYELQSQEWETTRFASSREFVLIEFTPSKSTKIWWVQVEDSDCYVTEFDFFKFCFKYDKNIVNIYNNLDTVTNRYMSVWQLSKISALK
jgi:hypothetical protein